MIARRAPGWTFEANLLGKLRLQVAWTLDEGGCRAWRLRLRLEYRGARTTDVHRAAGGLQSLRRQQLESVKDYAGYIGETLVLADSLSLTSEFIFMFN